MTSVLPDTLPPAAFWRGFCLAFAIAAAGGALFARLDVPLGWLIGAMTFTTVAAVSGLPLASSVRLRTLMVLVLGVLIGSAFTAEVVASMGAWIYTLLALLAFVIVAGAATQFLVQRFAGYDPVTAFFAAAPGGLTEMAIAGGQAGGDERVISLVHGVRIMVVVLTVPLGLRLLGDIDATGAAALPHAALALTPGDVIVLATAGVVGYAAGKVLALPAPQLTGPMLASAAAHVGGLTAATPPPELIALAQVIVGQTLGCRFVGVRLREVGNTLLVAAAIALVLIAIAIVFAAAASRILDVPFAPMMLALAPGGVTEMSLTALALNVDTAFVSTHHVARIAMVVVIAPLAFRMGRRLFETPNRRGPDAAP